MHSQDSPQVPIHADVQGDPNAESSSNSSRNNDASSPAEGGTWGERDAGPGVDRETALEDYEEMRRELSKLSIERTRSRSSIGRTHSHVTSPSTARSQPAQITLSHDASHFSDEETPAEESEFDLDNFLKNGHYEKRTGAGEPSKKVGVVYKNLTVKGVGSSSVLVKTLPQAIINTFGPDLYRLVTHFIPSLAVNKQQVMKDLIHDFTGAVRDGEMMLVLGRPGSGCSTFLKAIANERGSFAAVTGEVTYGGISAEEQKKHYKGEVNYNPEDDQHFPALTVWQTLRFALENKTKKKDRASVPIIIDGLLKMFGITHTKHTLVGNEYVRGVSGGERKRVSIAETLATKSTVVCWDNSTRGLDASTALDYAKSLRIMTDVSHRTTFVTLYQAGEGIYELMDKVLLIESGRMIYQGPAKDAKAYFQDLGYYCPDRQTTPDFLTSIGSPEERRFQPGKEASAPKTPEELEEAFRKSPHYRALLTDVEGYESRLQQSGHEATKEFKGSVQASKSKRVSENSNYTISFLRQVASCTQREFWLYWGSKTEMKTKAFIIICSAFIVGSLFYGQSLDTSGAFSRGGSLLFSSLFLGWLQLSELMKAVTGRDIIERHRSYAFYRPSAVVLSRVVLDLPVLLVEVVVFAIIVYFMADLDVEAGKFFIYMLLVYTNVISVTALYRMFAAVSPTLDDAIRFSGLAFHALILFAGYVIPRPTLINSYPWFGWLYYVNGVAWTWEAFMVNEFSGRTMKCSESMLVPQGPGVEPQYQGCTLTGSTPGSTNVSGDAYVKSSFDFDRSHLWRDWGIVVAITVGYVLITAIAAELLSFAGSAGGAMVYKRSKQATKQVISAEKPADEESGAKIENLSTSSSGSGDVKDEMGRVLKSESVFTWENVDYTVPYMGGERKLLNGVNGYVKPGVLIALMGASGAGKTTLLNTLSQRQKMGVVTGSMLVDGRPVPLDFQRGTGYCEQMDLHEGTATIREALEFSAVLRQDRRIPRQEKLKYVDQIIELLELSDIQDAIISSLGVEHRKRLTIGVELAAKPSLLLFLDEPTSGLDSQSAYSIVRFLKKLSQAGQAIICTIHQPSSVLIQEFDIVLALNPGGNTFYFGPVGENGSDIINYFAKRGTQCPPNKNVAEFVLETAAKGGNRGPDGKRINWNKEWLKSEENQALLAEISRLKAERSKFPAPPQTEVTEFAAPTTTQIIELTKRMFIAQWRQPSYVYGKLFVSVTTGLFVGFTFYSVGNSIAALQYRLFAPYLIILIPPLVINSIVPKFYLDRALWEARELPSRIYGWVAFCTAELVAEVPSAIIGGIIYWAIYFWAVYPGPSSMSAGYTLVMTIAWFFFQASFGQWLTAFAPSYTVISNVLPLFFLQIAMFNGIMRPYPQLPPPWKWFIYYVNPATYWLQGMLAATVSGVQIKCTEDELTLFNPPPNQTCGSYASDLIRDMGVGYLTNPDATSACEYCQYATGDEYLATVNVQHSYMWRDFGIFVAFCVSNWALVYLFIYTTRLKGWTFGFGPLFDVGGKIVGRIFDVLTSPFKKQEQKGVEDEKVETA